MIFLYQVSSCSGGRCFGSCTSSSWGAGNTSWGYGGVGVWVCVGVWV